MTDLTQRLRELVALNPPCGPIVLSRNETADLLAAHDARVTELLRANNREVERRRLAEKLAAPGTPAHAKVPAWRD
jgi:hypothetical protein